MAYEAATLNKLQLDVLFEDLEDNELLAPSSISSKNKALKTKKKTIIGAINELLEKINNIESTMSSSLNQQNNILGNFVDDPELITKLNNVAPSLIDGIIKLDSSVEDVPEDVTEEFVTTNQKTTEFNLNNIPLESNNNMSMTVNGISYVDGEFTYNRENNKVIWLFTKDNGGFDINEENVVTIKFKTQL